MSVNKIYVLYLSLNDDNDSILGELLTNLNETHFDEEMNKLLLIIGLIFITSNYATTDVQNVIIFYYLWSFKGWYW